MDLSTVVVHYRSLDALPTCLNALREATQGVEGEIVVVDNASGDGVAAWMASQHPDARLIENDENLGYAKAVNQGIAATQGEFVLVMNPDCFLSPDAVGIMMRYAREHPRAGIVGPQLLTE